MLYCIQQVTIDTYILCLKPLASYGVSTIIKVAATRYPREVVAIDCLCVITLYRCMHCNLVVYGRLQYSVNLLCEKVVWGTHVLLICNNTWAKVLNTSVHPASTYV